MLYITLPVITLCLALLVYAHRRFDLLAFGEVTAHSMGLDVDRFIRWVFIVTSIMIGMCVAVCGPIGFVGLVIPHILRLAFGGRHAFLLLASLIGGGAFLCFADALARVILPNEILPVGIITALIGGPILAVLLLKGGGYEVRD
jgi:iron complex transport system permease protein